MAGTGWANAVEGGVREGRRSWRWQLHRMLRGRLLRPLRRVLVARRVVSWRIGREPGTWWWLTCMLAMYVVVFSIVSGRGHSMLLGMCASGGTGGHATMIVWLIADLGRGLEVVTPEHPEYVEIAQRPSYGIYYFPFLRKETSGLVAPVVETTRAQLNVLPLNFERATTEAEIASVRALAVEALWVRRNELFPGEGQTPNPRVIDCVDRLRRGVTREHRLLPWGVLHDGVFVCVLWVVVGGWPRMRLAKRIASRVRYREE